MKQRTRVVFGADQEWVPNQLRQVVPTRGYVSGLARVVNAPSGLRLRDKAVDGNTLTMIPNGTTVNVGASSTPGWAYVEYGGHYGYSSNEYLEPVGGPNFTPIPNPPAPAPPPPAPAPPPPAPLPPPPAPPEPEPAPKSNTSLYIGLGVAGAAALLAFTLYMAKRNAYR